jgi:hypothetical protein
MRDRSVSKKRQSRGEMNPAVTLTLRADNRVPRVTEVTENRMLPTRTQLSQIAQTPPTIIDAKPPPPPRSHKLRQARSGGCQPVSHCVTPASNDRPTVSSQAVPPSRKKNSLRFIPSLYLHMWMPNDRRSGGTGRPSARQAAEEGTSAAAGALPPYRVEGAGDPPHGNRGDEIHLQLPRCCLAALIVVQWNEFRSAQGSSGVSLCQDTRHATACARAWPNPL